MMNHHSFSGKGFVSIRNLEYLLEPKSVAVIGASIREGSVGSIVLKNLLGGGFEGPILPVNPKYRAISGILAYSDVQSLPIVPDLAVICTPASVVPEMIAQLADKGTRAAIILSAGLDATSSNGVTLRDAALKAAKPRLMRLLGPNCLGLIRPAAKLNATFSPASVKSGRVAFVTQSGALVTAVLDWANSRQIGFSAFVSLGDSADVDFADIIDYLGSDPKTCAILLYIESIKHARKFMSAARAAARNKPLIVVKSGRSHSGALAARSHTGALAGEDAVYDAAIRRAGMLRVYSLEDLFNAAESLSRGRIPIGERLLIVTNGGGPGVLAADALELAGGQLAGLPESLAVALDKALPANWSRANPIDVIGDADPQRYRKVTDILLAYDSPDTILFIHAPTAVAPSEVVAQELAPLFAKTEKPLLTCWLGGDAGAAARRICGRFGIRSYDTPEDAIDAFMQLVSYKRNQEQLMETPREAESGGRADVSDLHSLFKRVLQDGRDMLTEPEAKQVLQRFGIAVVESKVAADAAAAQRCAREIGYPVVVKVLSRELSHKSDVGGVIVGLKDEQQVQDAIVRIESRVRKLRPDARIDGYLVQSMVERPGTREVIIGTYEDSLFGPVIVFGTGGTAVEVIGDRAIALPPLNEVLAKELVSRTQIAKLLRGYRERPPADCMALYRSLISLSQMVIELDDVIECDINPLLVDADGVIALDARIRISTSRRVPGARLAIRPYPKELEETLRFDGSEIMLRPIRPEDEPAHRTFFEKLSPDDLRFRFFTEFRSMPHTQLAAFTQIDYERQMAFVAIRSEADGTPVTLGVARADSDPDNRLAEFAIVVRSDIKGRGLGGLLMNKLIAYCRQRGTREMVGYVLPENRRMLALARRLGFESEVMTDDGVIKVRLALTP
ncbi:MAG: bifunctional acetate--CoA ligase family protein/GNAT family N-acetyltransferase [Methylococcaceae bacterium]|nr:bifunctional acetate--CoA ligase family protein/GNAT family N-acetyltransferase [Methylococcaceae bacterium]